MKPRLQAALVVAVVVALATTIIGCSRVDMEHHSVDDVKTVVIEGCEYLVVENGARIGNNYAFSMTHKGNCSNAIHKSHAP